MKPQTPLQFAFLHARETQQRSEARWRRAWSSRRLLRGIKFEHTLRGGRDILRTLIS